MSISRSKACEPTPSIWRAGGRKRRPELGEKGGHLGFSAWDSIHPSIHACIHTRVRGDKEGVLREGPACLLSRHRSKTRWERHFACGEDKEGGLLGRASLTIEGAKREDLTESQFVYCGDSEGGLPGELICVCTYIHACHLKVPSRSA